MKWDKNLTVVFNLCFFMASDVRYFISFKCSLIHLITYEARSLYVELGVYIRLDLVGLTEIHLLLLQMLGLKMCSVILGSIHLLPVCD